MRLIVTASQKWTDRLAIFGALDLVADAAKYNRETLTVVHGAAPGGDTIADAWVRERRAADWPVEAERHPADWTRLGRRAEILRNLRMVRLGADACLAFVLGASKGATHCAKECEAAGIRTEWIRRDYVWLPSSNLARLHAVRLNAKKYLRPVLKTRGTYEAKSAVCGREIETAVAPVLGELPRCRHCLKAVGDVA